jgi:hypothetical protein
MLAMFPVPSRRSGGGPRAAGDRSARQSCTREDIEVKRWIGAVAVAFSMAWAPAPGVAAEGDWLVGKWELSHDPDGSPKDWLVFEGGGKVTSHSPQGRSVSGDYSINEGSISIVFDLGNRALPMRLTYTPDRRKLLVHSKRTGNTSEYQRLK